MYPGEKVIRQLKKRAQVESLPVIANYKVSEKRLVNLYIFNNINLKKLFLFLNFNCVDMASGHIEKLSPEYEENKITSN